MIRLPLQWFCVVYAIGIARPCTADVFLSFGTDGEPAYSTTRTTGSRPLRLRASANASKTLSQVTHPQDEGTIVPIIGQAATRYSVDPALVRAVIDVESHFISLAVSPKGAVGAMQLTSSIRQQHGVVDPHDPHQNIDAGVRHLRSLIDKYNGNLDLVLAAYNAGVRRVSSSGKRIPANRETMNYVPTVLARYAFYRDMGGN